MNNIQLALFIEKYQVLLVQAISQVANDLPPELVEKRKNILGQESEVIPVLDPLYEVLSRMEDDVELLKKSGTASTIVNNSNRG
jgi:hypothetical protein